MPILKSETRIKQIDTSQPETNASEYAEGDVVYDQTLGIVRRDASDFGGVAIAINRSIETFQSLSGATGTVTHDCSGSNIFYHTTPAANWTANFTNVQTVEGTATNITIIISQGATPYMPTAVQIGGSAKTINWQGGAEPFASENGIDVVSFTIIQTGASTYVVLGQLVDFGG